MYRLFITMALTAATFATSAVAQDEPEKPWSIDLTSGFFSDYMFRGFNLYDGGVFQPSVTGHYDLGDFGSVSGSVWSSVVTESRKKDNSFTEADYTLSWSKQFGIASLTAGHVWYTYPHDKTDSIPASQELFASVAFDTLLTPTLSVYEDYDAFDTQYYELGLSHKVEDVVGEGFNMTPYVAFGFGTNAKKVYAEDGLEHVTAGLSFELGLGDVVVTPTLNYTFQVDDNTVNNFWSGLNFAYSF